MLSITHKTPKNNPESHNSFIIHGTKSHFLCNIIPFQGKNSPHLQPVVDCKSGLFSKGIQK